jgi:hypothetical protein
MARVGPQRHEKQKTKQNKTKGTKVIRRSIPRNLPHKADICSPKSKFVSVILPERWKVVSLEHNFRFKIFVV